MPKTDAKRKLSTNAKLCISAGAIAAATLSLYLAGRFSLQFNESVLLPYSRWIQHIISKITSIFPFSLAEIGLYLLILLAITGLVILIIALIKRPAKGRLLLRVLTISLVVASSVAFTFYSSWGMNYYSDTLANRLGYNTAQKHYSELEALNTYLVTAANDLASQLDRDENGLLYPLNFDETAKQVAAEFSKLTGRNETPVKAVLASVPMSYTKITGVFVFLTGEANVNTNSTPASIPFTMAHEMAHRYGIAREDEANFFAFYCLWQSEDPLLRYSAYMMSLTYCQNQLYRADRDSWRGVAQLQNADLVRDYDQYFSHWQQYEGKIADTATGVNNAYLQTQGQSDGVASYGRMTDLMLGWYTAR